MIPRSYDLIVPNELPSGSWETSRLFCARGRRGMQERLSGGADE